MPTLNRPGVLRVVLLLLLLLLDVHSMHCILREIKLDSTFVLRIAPETNSVNRSNLGMTQSRLLGGKSLSPIQHRLVLCYGYDDCSVVIEYRNDRECFTQTELSLQPSSLDITPIARYLFSSRNRPIDVSKETKSPSQIVAEHIQLYCTVTISGNITNTMQSTSLLRTYTVVFWGILPLSNLFIIGIIHKTFTLHGCFSSADSQNGAEAHPALPAFHSRRDGD